MTPQDLAEHLGIPVQTIYQWRSRDRGPVAHRVGRHIRYRVTDVESWLSANADAKASR
jgi:excisionase family DNA binding protein